MCGKYLQVKIVMVLLLIPVLMYAQEFDYHQQQWTNLKQKVNVSFADNNIHYQHDKIPLITYKKKQTLTAWAGEKINTSILIWTSQPLTSVSFSTGNFKNSKEQVIDKQNISCSFIKYVWTDGYFGNGCGKRNNQQLDSSLVADIIDTVSSVSLQKNTVQPVWVSIRIPASTMPGLYNGKIYVQVNEKVFPLDLRVQVLPYQLQPPSGWSFHLDLWQYPVSIAKFHKVPLWSNEHFKLMKPYYQMLAAAGQKNITISMIEGGNQGKEVSPAMIKWVKKKDGLWMYDYSLFDKYVSFVMSCGITKSISCYTMVPWSKEFSYYDEALQKDTVFVAETQSQQYKEFWQQMLKDFIRHLKEKRWFDVTAIAMDERKLPDMMKVIEIVREVDKDWKISLAGSYHSELAKEMFDYAVFRSQQFTKDELAYRNSKKMPTTFYTSCEGEKPNMFTFSSPAESVWMGWYAASKGFSGYLRWAYNLWNENPLQDSRNIFPAGDAFLIYPGPVSSVRFEKLIEGIQDYEKIKILRNKYQKEKSTVKLKQIEKILGEFWNERLEREEAATLVKKAKAFLTKLSM